MRELHADQHFVNRVDARIFFAEARCTAEKETLDFTELLLLVQIRHQQSISQICKMRKQLGFSRIDYRIGKSIGWLADEGSPSERQNADTPKSGRANRKFQRQAARSGNNAVCTGQFPIADYVLRPGARENPQACPFWLQRIANLAALARFDVNTIERRKEPLEIFGRLIEGNLYGVFKR